VNKNINYLPTATRQKLYKSCFYKLYPATSKQRTVCYGSYVIKTETIMHCNSYGFRCSFICQGIPRPGDSEGTFSVFESSCHLLLPV